MSLLFNMLSRLVIAFLWRGKCLLISWLQSPSAVILEPKKIKFLIVPLVSLSICHEGMGLDAMIFVFWMLSFMPDFSLWKLLSLHLRGISRCSNSRRDLSSWSLLPQGLPSAPYHSSSLFSVPWKCLLFREILPTPWCFEVLLAQVHVPDAQWGQTNWNAGVWSRERCIAGHARRGWLLPSHQKRNSS